MKLLLATRNADKLAELRRLLADERRARGTGEDRIAVGSIEAYLDHQGLRLSRRPGDDELMDAVWAATRLCWQCADAELPADAFDLADELTNRVRAVLGD